MLMALLLELPDNTSRKVKFVLQSMFSLNDVDIY